MKNGLRCLIILHMILATACQSTNQPHEVWKTYELYEGDDLGVTYTPGSTQVRVWAPPADEVIFRLYKEGHGDNLLESHPMKKDKGGTWVLDLEGDWKNTYYTCQARFGEVWGKEVPDPQARAVGVNGDRGMIVDLASTNPEGWEAVDRPSVDNPAAKVIWEVHVRDFSVHPSSGIQHKGKYLAFTETGTRSPEGLKTGIDHLVELGITHVHLLPVYDFYTIDETRLDEPQFNWGYDPKNYNVPEGSYATDPFDGNVRIREFKKMVQSLHQHGIQVIMDVVYNHMYDASSSPFEQLAPGYFFRMNPDGTYSDGSACGNETASERTMMRRFMIESLTYWAEEYRIDGFRFDLMGLHDIQTMNEIRAALDKVNPDIFLYGEGWTAGETPLPIEDRAIKVNAMQLDRIAVFSDDIRDGIRGHWYDNYDRGYMVGRVGVKESIKFGVVASTLHPQVNYADVNYSDAPYADNPLKTITYVTCHDNPCLWDKIVYTCIDCSKQEMLDIQKLANAIVLTSQGVPFLHAGEEIVRTKFGEHNTYNLPDSINQLVWTNKARYHDVFAFYRDMIALRLNHPAFSMTSTEMIATHLHFIDIAHELVVGFHLSEHANGDAWKDIVVYYNSGAEKAEVQVPAGKFRAVATKYGINERGLDVPGYDGIIENKAFVPPRSILILADVSSI